jgi:hypothetical protein
LLLLAHSGEYSCQRRIKLFGPSSPWLATGPPHHSHHSRIAY